MRVGKKTTGSEKSRKGKVRVRGEKSGGPRTVYLQLKEKRAVL